MCYLEHSDGETVAKDWLDAGTWEANIAGKRVPVSTSIRSWYDPQNQRPHLND
jgi:4-methylaminobutanoate oxidase (formaldehyde-forming)